MSDQPRDPDDLEPTGLPETEADDTSSPAGRQIGPYRLLDKLGEGGMGEVWLAEQTEPVKRKIALKVIKHGMDTGQVVARFEAERQALAMMDHPAIAKVYDAGATPRGRPYFAMEHVRGVPITDHCDDHRLTNRERLKLFMQVCEGVQHAHQKAVIHRDLKPSNVLVSIRDEKAVPKIIDFGVAKATAQKLTDKTMHTQLGVMIGTPAYMSPEQAMLTGQDVDTRTDVYALGVMLYELLVGALPFDVKELQEAGLEAMVRKIREDEPRRPSTRLTTLGELSTRSAERRRTDLPALERELSGDLDWITMKALEKDRTRRYGSPLEFAADIERYLTDQPVLARPPSAAYRARKFVRRHKLGVAAAAVLVAGLAFGVVGSTVGYLRARRAEARATKEAETSQRVSGFLADMLGGVNPARTGRSLVKDLRKRAIHVRMEQGETAEQAAAAIAPFSETLAGVNATDAGLRLIDKEILNRAASRIDDELGEDPELAARLYDVIGNTYERLGLYEPAGRHLTRAWELRLEIHGPEHVATLASREMMGVVFERRGDYERAEEIYREVLDTANRVLGPDHLRTLWAKHNLAIMLRRRGLEQEAVVMLEEVSETGRRTLGSDDYATLWWLNNLAKSYMDLGRLDDAEVLFDEVLKTRRRVLGENHPRTLATESNLIALKQHQGQNEELLPLMLDSLERARRVHGNEHLNTLLGSFNLAVLYVNLNQYEKAGQLATSTLEIARRALGPDHDVTLNTMEVLGSVLRRQDRHQEAVDLYRELVAARSRREGAEGRDTLVAQAELAMSYAASGEHDRGMKLLDETIESLRRVFGEDDRATIITLYNAACFEARAGNRDRALGWLRQAVDAGYGYIDWLLQDGDLDSLRGDAEFEGLVERVRENASDGVSDSG